MSRRTFLGSAGLAAIGSRAVRAEAAEVRPKGGADRTPGCFLLESYLLKNGSQAQRLASYFQLARIGTARRLGIPAPAFVLEALVAAHMPQVLAVSGFDALDGIGAMKRKLRKDSESLAAMAQWEATEEPPYEELNETVLEAAAYCPTLPSPAPGPAKPPRIFELRTYHSPTERQLTALHERFAGAEIKIFHRCGIHPVLYSSTLIGANKPNLTYLIPFEDLATREKAWAAFGADPEWTKVRADSIAKHGQISSVIQMSLFKAATYSPVR